MAVQVRVRDEQAPGSQDLGTVLEFLAERVTARQIIRAPIYQEVQAYNRSGPGVLRGLVQPETAEAVPGGYRLRKHRHTDWQKQFDAFFRRGFLIRAGDHQPMSLDEELTTTPGMDVTFLRLVPLVGG